MAKSKTAIAVRRAPTVPKKKYEMALAARNAAGRRAREAAEERIGVVVGAVAGYGIGALEKKGTRIPTVAGIEPTLLYGGLASFGPALLGIRGRAANIIAEAGAASLGIAAYKFGLGHPMVGEDE